METNCSLYGLVEPADYRQHDEASCYRQKLETKK